MQRLRWRLNSSSLRKFSMPLVIIGAIWTDYVCVGRHGSPVKKSAGKDDDGKTIERLLGL